MRKININSMVKTTSNIALHAIAGAASATVSAIAAESVYTDISLKQHPLCVTHKGIGPWKKTIISRPGAKSLYPISSSATKIVTSSAAAVGAVSGGVYGAQLDKTLKTISAVDIRPTVDVIYDEDDDEDEGNADSTNTTSTSDTSESSSDSKSKWTYDKATKSFVNKSAK